MPELTFDYKTEAPRVKKTLEAALPGCAVYTSEGYKGRVHVKVIADQFVGKSPEDRQAYVYDILRSVLGSGSQVVTLVSAYSPEEV